MMSIRQATQADLAAISELLKEASLPTGDVERHVASFLVGTDGGEIAGAIGLELYGHTALVRSAVIAPNARGRGLGSRLYSAVEERARREQVGTLVLLTTTAEPFFLRKGFAKVTRADITGSILSSTEFTGACPSSAVLMRKILSPRILVLCTGNSCRSQMAAEFLRSLDAALEVHSAGTAPAAQVHPLAVRVMQEIGRDISGRTPMSVERFLDQTFDYVITVCDNARETCPVFVGRVGQRRHIGFPDPAAVVGSPDEVLAAFRKSRDTIRETMTSWYHSLTPRPRAS